MEMTPISARDVPVSSAVGANAHGRDTSSSEHTEETTTTQDTKPEFQLKKPEVPIDRQADTVAARLQMVDPGMDPTVANKIAKALLAAPKWELKMPPPPPGDDKKHVDVSA